MAQLVDTDFDLAVALYLSQENDTIYRTDTECYIESVAELGDDVWLDDLLSKEKLEDLLGAESCENLDLSDATDIEFPLSTTTAAPPSPCHVTHEHFELTDPTPSIHQLFTEYNQLFFYDRLGGVSVEWSHKMTSCAGITYYKPNSMFCFIRLSKPILTLRPRKDLVETLLHEMIHAFLFVAEQNRDHSDHGTQFQRHQQRINGMANCKITIYHSFHEEVMSLRTHWWRCQGVCRSRPPYYGYVKRSVNRAPASSDRWWGRHSATCGGTFLKIRSPPKPVNKKTTKTATGTGTNPQPTSDIKLYFKTEPEPIHVSSLPDNELSNLECIDITLTPPHSPIVVHSGATPVNSGTRVPATQPTPPRHFQLKQCIFCSGYFQVAQIETHIDECVSSFSAT